MRVELFCCGGWIRCQLTSIFSSPSTSSGSKILCGSCPGSPIVLASLWATWLRLSNPDARRAGALLPRNAQKTPNGVFCCLLRGLDCEVVALVGSSLRTHGSQRSLRYAAFAALLHGKLPFPDPFPFESSPLKISSKFVALVRRDWHRIVVWLQKEPA